MGMMIIIRMNAGTQVLLLSGSIHDETFLLQLLMRIRPGQARQTLQQADNRTKSLDAHTHLNQMENIMVLVFSFRK